MKIALYVVSKKGYMVLNAIVHEFGTNDIAYVVVARDGGVDKDWCDEIQELCRKSEIKFFDRSNGFDPSSAEADFSLAIGWRWMIRNRENLIVLHDSLLPKYRGFSPLVNMLIDGRSRIGVTALFATDEYDKGPIIAQESAKIQYPIKIAAAIDKVIPIYTSLAVDVFRQILTSHRLDSVQQDESEATYSLWRDDDDYFINWADSAENIVCFVNAVGSPYAGATALLKGELVRLIEVDTVSDVVVENRQAHIGKTIFFDKGFPVVICGSGLLKIISIVSSSGDSILKSLAFRSRFEGR